MKRSPNRFGKIRELIKVMKENTSAIRDLRKSLESTRTTEVQEERRRTTLFDKEPTKVSKDVQLIQSPPKPPVTPKFVDKPVIRKEHKIAMQANLIHQSSITGDKVTYKKPRFLTKGVHTFRILFFYWDSSGEKMYAELCDGSKVRYELSYEELYKEDFILWEPETKKMSKEMIEQELGYKISIETE